MQFHRTLSTAIAERTHCVPANSVLTLCNKPHGDSICPMNGGRVWSSEDSRDPPNFTQQVGAGLWSQPYPFPNSCPNSDNSASRPHMIAKGLAWSEERAHSLGPQDNAEVLQKTVT